MPADLQLSDRSPADLRLARDRTGADLWLQDRALGDLRLARPPDRSLALQGVLPALQSQLAAQVEGVHIAELQGILPPLQSQLAAELAADGKLHGNLPALVSHMEAAYDNAVWRGIESTACGVWQPGLRESPSTCTIFAQTEKLRTEACFPWRLGEKIRGETASAFGPLSPLPGSTCAVEEAGALLMTRLCGTFADLTRQHLGHCAPHQSAKPILTVACLDWIDLLRTERPAKCNPYQEAVLLVQDWCGGYTDALRTRLDYCAIWETGRIQYGWGGLIIIPPPPPPPDPCRNVGRADLVLRQFRDTSTFILRECLHQPGSRTRYIPILKVYLVSNDVHLIRVADSLELPTFAMSVAIDADNWGWEFSAELPADQLTNVQPVAEPVEVEAQINTITWRFLVEQIRRTRSFGRSRINISGRSLAARLDAPYVGAVNRKNTIDLNATQILDDLLTENGVPIGWTIDWQLSDWLVTTGAWAHAGTYLEGVKTVAEAAGAIIQADRTGQTLHLLHRYPVAPWDWSGAGPAYVVPEAIVTTEGVEWLEKPPYNAVFVSGENLGILGHVTRTGTAGDIAAPMVVHPLVTAQAAARQRGLAILGDTGKQQRLELSMPFDPVNYGIGLMTPTTLIEYGPEALRGMVRATRIEVRNGSVRQTISLETHP